MKLAPKRTSHACQRCRRQKLKCDAQRPCVLCTRAGVECVALGPSIWKTDYQSSVGRKRKRKSSSKTKKSVIISREDAQSISDQPVMLGETELVTDTAGHQEDEQSQHPQSFVTGGSSSTMAFVKEAFTYHSPMNSLGTKDSEIDSHLQIFSTGKPRSLHDPPQSHTLPHSRTRQRNLEHGRVNHSIKDDLLESLPSVEVGTLLVNNYFDRIHWFLLLFHQADFRARFQQLYDTPGDETYDTDVGILSIALAVCTISLEYLSDHCEQLLVQYQIQAQELKNIILAKLKCHYLEVVALGSLEAAQTCALLGTYYLYQGEPDLAWPICGCGLRIAQALHLHRKTGFSLAGVGNIDPVPKRACEARKRCWWTIYEIETSCSMLYGLPPSIADEDCDVGFLDSYAINQTEISLTSTSASENPFVTLLFYKKLMSKLSIIVKSALIEVYGIRHTSLPASETTPESYDLHLSRKVSSLNDRLRTWKDELPKKLRFDGSKSVYPDKHTNEKWEFEVGASGLEFDEYLYQLQWLALKFAYENARILINRPLLCHRTRCYSSGFGETNNKAHTSGPCQTSAQICLDAASETSCLGSVPIFQRAADTFAAGFIGAHMFTAGITLCIIASVDPLNHYSHEAKLGLRRLMQMQSCFKSKTPMAEQGLHILRKLTSLIMKRELSSILNISPVTEEAANTVLQLSDETEAIKPTICNTSKSPDPGVQEQQDWNTQNPAEWPIGRRVGDHSTFLESESQFDAYNHVNFDIADDSTISQAIADFDKATNADYQLWFNETDALTDTSRDKETTSITSQEQGWIWNFDFFSEANMANL